MVGSIYDGEKLHDSREVEMVENSVIAAPLDPNDKTDISILDVIKGNTKVLIYCVCMTMGPLISTYGELRAGSSMYILPSLWLSLWNAFTQAGVMIGSMANGPLTDRFGRRISFFVGGIVACIATAIIYFADRVSDINGRRGTFLAGKIVLGFGMGILNSTFLGQMISVAIVFAQIKVQGETAYRVAFASQWAFAGLVTILALLVPESPIYLLKRNKVESARKSLVKLHDPSTADASIVALQAALEHERKLSASTLGIGYLECFKGSNWRRTRIVLIANAVQQFLGITLVANSTYFLELDGMAPTNVVMVLCIGVSLGLLANVISWFTRTIFGRRFILLASSLWVAVCWLTIGIAGCFNTSTALCYIGVMLNMIIFFFGLGVGGTYTVVAAETSSVNLRAKTNSLGFFINGFSSWGFNFFIPYLFNADQLNWVGKCGFFFFGLSLIALLVIYSEIPEMKNRTYCELDDMFEKRLKTRVFKNHSFIQTL